MITAEDLICLPYTPDLSEAGISYACRSLPHTYDRMGGSPFDRLRRIVSGIAVELVFRRFLTSRDIPFDVRGATPFTEPDRYDVSLGGHRCDVKSFLISYREQITGLHADPSQLLRAPALVPLDQHAGNGASPEDIYLFAFLTGLTASSSEDVRRAMVAGQPVYLIHTMPSTWVRPRAWTPLGPLALKSECGETLRVEIGGQDAQRDFVIASLEVPPRLRVQMDERFHSLVCMHVSGPPDARLGIHSPVLGETHLIQPDQWGNIWLYGMRIYLAGWITRDEFRQRATLLPEGSRVFQYDRTRTKNLAVPMSDLHPLDDLLSRVRTWAGSRAKRPD